MGWFCPQPSLRGLQWCHATSTLAPRPVHERRVSYGKTLGGADLYRRWEPSPHVPSPNQPVTLHPGGVLSHKTERKQDSVSPLCGQSEQVFECSRVFLFFTKSWHTEPKRAREQMTPITTPELFFWFIFLDDYWQHRKQTTERCFKHSNTFSQSHNPSLGKHRQTPTDTNIQ